MPFVVNKRAARVGGKPLANIETPADAVKLPPEKLKGRC